MILIDNLYRRVNNDLFLKGKGGYISGDEFNRGVVDTQSYLQEFFIHKEKENRRIVEALAPFVVETTIAVSSGYVALPSDYAHKRDIYMQVMQTNCVGNTVAYDDYPMDELKSGEYSNLLQSPIRKPSIADNEYAWEPIGSNLKIYPSDTVGQVYLKYIKNPPAAVWGFTLDTANDQENYDAASSTDLEWNPSEMNALVNIMLYLKGVAIRDSEVINWISANKPLVESQ